MDLSRMARLVTRPVNVSDAPANRRPVGVGMALSNWTPRETQNATPYGRGSARSASTLILDALPLPAYPAPTG